MYKLMIVDDELYIREVLKRIIPWEEYGFSISATAEDGEQALDCIRKDPPHLIIADIEMPFITGIELAETLADSNPEIKIILLTGHDKLTYAHRAIKRGVYDYLLKPTIASELVAAITAVRAVLDKEHMEKDMLALNEGVFSILETNMIGTIQTKDFKLISSTLKNTLVNAGNLKAPHPYSRSAVITLLMNVLEKFCKEEGMPFARAEDELDDNQLINFVIHTIFGYNLETVLKNNDITVEAKKFIIGHYKDPDLSLKKIAREIHVNPTYLSRVFNQAAGKSLPEYISEIRLSQAIILFNSGAVSVENVSAQVGFSNASYFSKCFKEEYGITPSEFVK